MDVLYVLWVCCGQRDQPDGLGNPSNGLAVSKLLVEVTGLDQPVIQVLFPHFSSYPPHSEFFIDGSPGFSLNGHLFH